ncbi:MAG TPA: methyltransferase domain-containing protein [Usitatibacter sp.]|nr:methyltransferase domain-containing protein [Usitatibacter sp.]
MAADLDRAVRHYRDLAPRYDHFTRRINAIRIRTIEALRLAPGEVVVDAGCGTGWCLPRLAAEVEVQGRVIGFDPSPEMLDQARARMAGHARAPELIEATGEAVRLPARADALLFSYTHDLIRSRRALANLFSQASPGARVAATSTKLYAPWLFPANWYLRYTHRAYITNFDSFEAPWSLLAELLDDFRIETSGWTQHYVATGRVRPQAA